MVPKLVQKVIKNRVDFRSELETTFSRSWVDFCSKNLSKMKALRATFSTLLRIGEKCDFEQPSNDFVIFFDFRGGRISTLKGIFFKCFLEHAFQRYFFGFGVDFWSKLEPKWEPKLMFGSIWEHPGQPLGAKMARRLKNIVFFLPILGCPESVQNGPKIN